MFLQMPVRGKGSGVATEKEKEFIRLISDSDRVQAMVAKVKVSASGGWRGREAQKKGGKGGSRGGCREKEEVRSGKGSYSH